MSTISQSTIDQIRNDEVLLERCNTGDVQDYLRRLQKERNIAVLFAVESGSRMWGFPSKNSDYDVRFIYVNQPDWYATNSFYLKDDVRGRDTITSMISSSVGDELDFHGWDLVKAAKMVKASNPSLSEWLQSHISYVKCDRFTGALKVAADRRWSPQAAFGHYMSMVHNNVRDYLKGERVRYKKYLYVIRPLLCANYVMETMEMPPMKFLDLLERSKLRDDGPALTAIMDLYQRKIEGEELEDCPTNPVLNEFIETWTASLEKKYKMHCNVGRWPNREFESNEDLQELVTSGLRLHMSGQLW